MPKNHCLVAVDIRSTHNVGSLFRSCDGFGANIVLVGITPAPIHTEDSRLPHIAKKAHKDIAKTALGAENTVNWSRYDDLKSAVKELKAQGYLVVAVEQTDTSLNMKNLHTGQPVALVVGREVEGLSAEELAMCDEVYEIPMYGNKESFNVSVAAGVALYQVASSSM